jgi:flagellar biosynthesis protein FliR
MLEALGDSFVVLKPGDPLPLRLLGTATTFNFISLTADLFLIAFRLSTPVLVVLLVLDVALGLTNRVAPQIQVNFVSMEIKASLGLFVILVTFALLINVEFPVVIQAVRRWLAAFQT